MIKSRLTDLLGIKYPVIQGGMVWISDWRLASAVSNAGGLGVLGSGSMDPDQVRFNIKKMKEKTNRPWALNAPILRPGTEEIIKIALEQGVNFFTTSAGNPSGLVPLIRRDDTIIIHVVPTVKAAIKAQDYGYDAVLCEGYEAGGHNGMDETGTIALVPQVVDAVDIPVVAAGGIADGRGIAAAFALGAEGVQMGTRFIATIECPAHENFKKMLIHAPDSGTTITGRHTNMLRCLKNEYTIKLAEEGKDAPDQEEFLALLVSEQNRSELGMVKGDIDQGVLMAGQSSGLINEIQTVAGLFETLEKEYHNAVARLK